MNEPREAVRLKIAKALEHLEKIDTAPLSALDIGFKAPHFAADRPAKGGGHA